jgi:hypothetical protein
VLAATLVALAALVAWAWPSRPFGDFAREAAAAAGALGRLDLGAFFAAAPAYGGSLLLAAPWAVLAEHTGRGTTWLYGWLLVPSLLALGAWAVAVGGALRDQPPLVWLAATALVAANPLAREAIAFGPGEELLVGVGCAAAVASAVRGRPALAGLLLGLAVGAKPWAVIAVGPVLWAARDRGDVVRIALPAASAAAALALPLLLLAPATVRSAATIATDAGAISHSSSVWFGLELLRGADAPAAWVQRVTHPLALLAAVALPLVLGAARGRRREDALLVLALALLVRCLLDTWTVEYYALPAILALAGHEALVRRRAPLGAAALTCLVTLAMTGPLAAPVAWAVFVSAGVGALVVGVAALGPRRSAAAAQPATPAIASTASA